MDGEHTQISTEKAKEYAANLDSVASACESMMKSEGWGLFMALFEIEKRAIKDTEDYATIEEFRADRGAIKIVEAIIEKMRGYISDAQSAAELFQRLQGKGEDASRGIMMIDAVEQNRES